MATRAAPLVLRLASLVGVAPERLLRAGGLEEEPTAIRFEDGVHLWEALAELTSDAYVGLTAGRRMQIDTLGMFGLAFATAHDLAGGLRVAGHALPMVLRDAEIDVTLDADGGSLVYRQPRLLTRHGVDSLLAGLLSLARLATREPALTPDAVTLQMPPPDDPGPYLDAFGVAPTFGASRCRLRFAPADLARPFGGADPATSAVLLDHAAVLLGTPPSGARRSTISAAFLRSLDRGNGTLDDTAAILGVSPRTLQRQLRNDGLSFKDLREEILAEEARRGLAAGDAVDAVASRLGYASRSSFERAFRRWTGGSTRDARRPRGPIGDD